MNRGSPRSPVVPGRRHLEPPKDKGICTCVEAPVFSAICSNEDFVQQTTRLDYHSGHSEHAID